MGNETNAQPTSAPNQSQILTLDEARKLQGARQTSPIVDGLIEEGALIVLAGEPKDGKSMLVANLSSAVAKGDKWLGKRVRQGRVLWFAYEENLQEWLFNFKPYSGIESDVLVVIVPPKIDSSSGIEAISKLLDEYKPTLLVIDPLVAATEDTEFDRQGLTRAKLQPLKQLLMQRDCAALVIHHLSKGTARGSASHDRISGSKQIEAAGSGAWVMTVKERNGIRLIDLHVRQRGPANGTVLHIDSPKMGKFTLVQKRGRTIPEGNAADRVLNFIDTKGPATQERLRGELNLSQSAVSKACSSLVNKGLLAERTDPRPATYSAPKSLTQDGTIPNQPGPGSPATLSPAPSPKTRKRHRSAQSAPSRATGTDPGPL